MKHLLDFGVRAPLTLEMGHPIETRLKQLRHVDRDKKVLPTAIGALLLLGSSISSVSAKTDEIIKQAAVPILTTIEAQSKSKLEKALFPTSVEKSLSPVDKSLNTGPEQALNEAVPVTVKMAAVEPRGSGLKPMRLRMSPYFTTAQLNAFTEERKRLVETDPSASGAFNGEYINISYFNRFEVVVDDKGRAIMRISKGGGGWPGYPKNNTDWHQRPLSMKMQQAMQSIIDRCAKSSGPVYFKTPILDGDADMGKGNFEIECTPGSIATQNRTSAKDLAYAWLSSEDIRLERRQSNMGWKMNFALMDEYVQKMQNGSVAKDRAECVRIHTLIKAKYSFTETDKAGQDQMIENCAKKDYNWIRKRNNLPEVQ